MPGMIRNAVGILVCFFLCVGPLMAQETGTDPAATKESTDELPSWMQKKLKEKEKKTKAEASQPEVAPESATPASSTLPNASESGELSEPEKQEESISMEPVVKEGEEEAAKEEKEEEGVPTFHLGRLFSMRSVKPSASQEMFVVGMVVRMAPVQAVIKSEMENLKNEYPELEEGLELLQHVDIEELDAELDALEGSTDQIPSEYLEATGLTGSQQELLGSLDREALKAVVETVQVPEEAITFSMEPFVTFNFDLLSLSVVLPMAGFSHGGETSFDLGNITTDLRFGHQFG